MKTLNKMPINLIEVEYIPNLNDMEFGIFYYSQKYQTSSHICPCGCGEEFPIPIKDNEWIISDRINLTISQSLSHRIKCKSHYVIKNGFVHILRMGLPKSMWYGNYGFHDSQPGE